jgi:uncharacterized membrane protein YqiK
MNLKKHLIFSFIILYYIILYYIILYYINILQTIGMDYITDPNTLESYSIFSEKGLKLLKEYVRVYQEGGNATTYLTSIGESTPDLAEARRAAEEAAEARRAAEEAAEARRAAEEAAEARRAAEEAAEARRAEAEEARQAARRAEAERQEAERQAEVARQAEAERQAEVARQAEAEEARQAAEAARRAAEEDAAANPCANVNANNMQLYRAEAEETNNDTIKDTGIAATLKLIRVEHTPENCEQSVNLGEPFNTNFKNNAIWRAMSQSMLVDRILRYPNNVIIQVPAEYAQNKERLGEANLENVGREGIGFVIRYID